MDFGFDDFDLDIADMGMALGLGDELSQGALEQLEAERDSKEERDSELDIAPLSERHTISGASENHNGYYDPFMHYANEVSVGKRKTGDLTGIDFNDGLDAGPDKNGNY